MLKTAAFTQFPALDQINLAKLEAFGRQHRTLLQTAGLVMLAAAGGALLDALRP